MTVVRPSRRPRNLKRPLCRSLSSCGASGEPGNFARDKRPARFAPVGGSVALKFEFSAHSIDVSTLEPIMRQARTWTRPCADGAAPLCGSDDSVFKVQCPPWPLAGRRTGLFGTARYVCFSGDDRGFCPRGSEKSASVSFQVKCDVSPVEPLGSIGLF